MKQRHSDIIQEPAVRQSLHHIKEIERAVSQLDATAKGIGLRLLQGLGVAAKVTDRTVLAEVRRGEVSVDRLVGLLRSPGARHTDKADLEVFAPVDAHLNGPFAQVIANFQELLANVGSGATVERYDVLELCRFITEELDPALHGLNKIARHATDQIAETETSLALTDELTGLPNRRAFRQLAHRMSEQTAKPVDVAVMHIDLDRLKSVNDLNGHATGDAAIRHAADCIKTGLQPSDFAARIGGDEFVLVVLNPASAVALAKRANQLIETISAPFELDSQRCAIGASVGISTGSCDSEQALEKLLNNADMALYSSKNAGRGAFAFFENEMRSKRTAGDELARDIVCGIDEGQFVPFFQPQVEGRTGKIVGFESLVRWHHPERGLLLPFRFIAVAEENGLLAKIDAQITEKVLSAMRRWLDQKLPVPQVSLNLTAERLNDPDIVERLTEACARHRVPAASVGIEVLESIMFEDRSRRMIDNLCRLSDVGFRIELDDFGTGHTSIANLRYLKIDRIKIDKSFVKNIHEHSDLSMITASIIGLAHNLRVDVLAEGVERPEERLILNALGCDHIQGFGVAAPMPEEDVQFWVRSSQSSAREKLSFA